MLFKKAVLPVVIMAALAGCGDAALDGTSEDALNQSISSLIEKLPHEHQGRFNTDIELVLTYYKKNDPERLLTNLNGKNALDIMSEAENLRAQIQFEQDAIVVEEQRIAYFESLKSRKAYLTKALFETELRRERHEQKNKFTTDSAIIYHEKDGDEKIANRLELQFTNHTGHTIHGVLLTGELSAADEIVLVAPLDIHIPEGIEPGQTKKFFIKPSLVSEWRTVDVPEGASLFMDIDEITDVGSNILFQDSSFTEKDHTHLMELKASLKVLNEEIAMMMGHEPVHAEVTLEKSVPPGTVQAVEPEIAIEIPADELPEVAEDGTQQGVVEIAPIHIKAAALEEEPSLEIEVDEEKPAEVEQANAPNEISEPSAPLPEGTAPPASVAGVDPAPVAQEDSKPIPAPETVSNLEAEPVLETSVQPTAPADQQQDSEANAPAEAHKEMTIFTLDLEPEAKPVLVKI